MAAAHAPGKTWSPGEPAFASSGGGESSVGAFTAGRLGFTVPSGADSCGGIVRRQATPVGEVAASVDLGSLGAFTSAVTRHVGLRPSGSGRLYASPCSAAFLPA